MSNNASEARADIRIFLLTDIAGWSQAGPADIINTVWAPPAPLVNALAMFIHMVQVRVFNNLNAGHSFLSRCSWLDWACF